MSGFTGPSVSFLFLAFFFFAFASQHLRFAFHCQHCVCTSYIRCSVVSGSLSNIVFVAIHDSTEHQIDVHHRISNEFNKHTVLRINTPYSQLRTSDNSSKPSFFAFGIDFTVFYFHVTNV